MSSIDYYSRIPNNVDLESDRRLRRALESWQPHFLEWWKEAGPQRFQANEIYLRTAVDVGSRGWAHFGHVRMPEYRWGIFLANRKGESVHQFGQHKGESLWEEVPGEYRPILRRLIVIQGDTEPASVEQQRHLGNTTPSLYDLRNLFQVNVEEGRHLWAMVYLLHKYFGRTGREEAEMLLQRRSGDLDKPRMLSTFNEPTPDWLRFFMFTFFTDRDGKFQLASLAESGFDPLARTCRFMLTEEAHHMFVGESGIARIIQRTCEVMRETGAEIDDVRRHGVIDLPTVQKYLTMQFSSSLDLFGQEISTNAAVAYNHGLKGRFNESKIDDDHLLHDGAYPVLAPYEDGFRVEEVTAINAVNERLRDDYIADCQAGVNRWNQIIRKHGIDYQLKLPHKAFNRSIGHFADLHVSPDGKILHEEEWRTRMRDWIPSEGDQEFVGSLMQKPVLDPGKFANWIAPPRRGINNKPVDFEYVR